ncbi:MAG: MerR family DNA-binding transcriptional regulator [Oleiphilus sp.]
MTDFSIGMLSKKTGCKVPTIRYYEQVGLLPEPYRTEGPEQGIKDAIKLSI